MTDTTNTDDEFSYDATPAGGATTLTDAPQGGGDGNDQYDQLGDEGADLKIPTEKSTSCLGFAAKPRVNTKDGITYIWVDLTCVEPENLAGRKDGCGGAVKGGKPEDCQKTLENLAKLARQVGATWDSSSLKNTMRDLEVKLADAGSLIAYKLNKGTRGGVFVNM